LTPNLTDARRRWLSELYESNSVAVFSQCQRLLNSREDAADATHEVFLRAAASLSEAPDSPQARAWLIKVARNYSIDVLRRRERFGSAMTTLGATADAVDESTEAVEDRQLLLAVLLQLGVRDREALWQSAVEQRPVGEIARSFGLTYLAAAQLLSRARRRALLLATRLAVILGLAQLGRAARRSNLAQRSQQLAALVAVPLVIVGVVASSSPRPPIAAAAAQSPRVLALGPSVGHRTRVTNLVPGGPTAPPATVPAATSAVGLVLAARATAVRHAPAPVVVPSSPPIGFDRDVDHGKGRDRDDTVHTPPGKALGHRK
jgi:RNA polymerase sigma factor (sigma-70 family)